MTAEDLSSVPLLRREPYRLFFPLGVALAWVGIGHWLLHAMRVIPEYRPIFHAMTQVQGFLTCMAAGFLFTMVPRRTQSAPAAAWEIGVCAVAPLITVAAAWNQWWVSAQLAWVAAAVVLFEFSLRRFHGNASRRRPTWGPPRPTGSPCSLTRRQRRCWRAASGWKRRPRCATASCCEPRW